MKPTPALTILSLLFDALGVLNTTVFCLLIDILLNCPKSSNQFIRHRRYLKITPIAPVPRLRGVVCAQQKQGYRAAHRLFKDNGQQKKGTVSRKEKRHPHHDVSGYLLLPHTVFTADVANVYRLMCITPVDKHAVRLHEHIHW
jgi:hypothetical protein